MSGMDFTDIEAYLIKKFQLNLFLGMFITDVRKTRVWERMQE